MVEHESRRGEVLRVLGVGVDCVRLLDGVPIGEVAVYGDAVVRGRSTRRVARVGGLVGGVARVGGLIGSRGVGRLPCVSGLRRVGRVGASGVIARGGAAKHGDIRRGDGGTGKGHGVVIRAAKGRGVKLDLHIYGTGTVAVCKVLLDKASLRQIIRRASAVGQVGKLRGFARPVDGDDQCLPLPVDPLRDCRTRKGEVDIAVRVLGNLPVRDVLVGGRLLGYARPLAQVAIHRRRGGCPGSLGGVRHRKDTHHRKGDKNRHKTHQTSALQRTPLPHCYVCEPSLYTLGTHRFNHIANIKSSSKVTAKVLYQKVPARKRTQKPGRPCSCMSLLAGTF